MNRMNGTSSATKTKSIQLVPERIEQLQLDSGRQLVETRLCFQRVEL